MFGHRKGVASDALPVHFPISEADSGEGLSF